MPQTMKKILCPCDFTNSSLRGIEYAAEICKKINGNITLCHIQTSIWPEAVFMEPVLEESVEITQEKMNLIASNVSRQFGIETFISNPRSTDTIEREIGQMSSHFDLIIMGTNGIDDNYQFLFGSTAFNVANQSECPVMMVPETYSNHDPEGIVYLHQDSVNPGLDILVPVWWSQLMDIPFGIWIIPSGDHYADQQLVRTITRELNAGGPENLISFVELLPDSEKSTLRKKWVHALPINHHPILPKYSGKKLIKKLTSLAASPVLVFGIESN